jgi:predicted DCC family thiol-disulfide oxidoreductase YuxK
MAASELILFDGVCNLCSGSVAWIIRRDKRERFVFASLQSPAGKRALSGAWPVPDSVVLVRGEGEQARLFFQSDAIIEIARGLGLPWSLVVIAKPLPRKLRDMIYGWIARNRYRWFGRKEACMVPTQALRKRFVE